MGHFPQAQAGDSPGTDAMGFIDSVVRLDLNFGPIRPSPAPPAVILPVVSAVDVLSVLLLPVLGPPANCLLVSTAGTARRLPRWRSLDSVAEPLCGYDADPPGDQAAQTLSKASPNCTACDLRAPITGTTAAPSARLAHTNAPLRNGPHTLPKPFLQTLWS